METNQIIPPVPPESPVDDPGPPESLELPTEEKASSLPEAASSSEEAIAPTGVNVAEIADKVLSFLSTATPELLGVTVFGIALLLYMILGTLGLMLIGVIVGVVLHASLEDLRSLGIRGGSGTTGLMTDWLEKRLAESDALKEGDSGDEKAVVRRRRVSRLPKNVDFSSLSPGTAAAFEELTEAVIRDYVRYWYTPILPNDEKFPNSCRQLLTQTLLNMHGHISSKRPTDTFLLFLVSTSNTFIVFFRELAQTAQSSIGTYIEEYPSSALAQLVDRESQRRKLRMAADDILQTFLPAEAVDCAPVRTFLTEILAGVVLAKTVEMCSSSDFINDWIIYLLEAETQPEILQKIDIGAVEGSAEAAAADEQRANQKRLSRAEEEMEKAMKEAQELSKMIAEDEAKAARNSMEIGVSPTTATSGILKNGITESPVRTSLDNKGVSFPSIPPEIPEESSREEEEKPPTPPPRPGAFTSFDQLVVPVAEPQEIFYRARVELSDLTPVTNGADKPLRSRPTSSMYLLQIEPASSSIPGWIVTRKYPDFEALHEVLSRISKISGVVGFGDLPVWKGQTKESLRGGLEKYLNSALKIHGLAECEGMKRFLEKDNATTETPNNGPGGFARLGKAWPNPQALAKVGGGMFDALTKAPQGAAEGGKALFGGVFRNGVVIKRLSASSTTLPPPQPSEYANSTPQNGATTTSRSSIESLRLTQPTRERSKSTATINELQEADLITLEFEAQQPPLPPRPSSIAEEPEVEARPELPPRRTSARQSLAVEMPGIDDGEILNLPPPPSDMPDDYDHDSDTPATLSRHRANSGSSSLLQPNTSLLSTSSSALNLQSITLPPQNSTSSSVTATTPPPEPSPRKKPPPPPLSPAETQFVVEIVFAIISELYTLSSAWLFRRSLLNVAKSILLRPGNSSLESIRVLIQETVIEANTKDKAVAGYIRKLRESAFASKEEVQAWQLEKEKQAAEEGEDAAEEKREKARRLVKERGLPEALRGVMGGAASAECCGVMFDALQEEGVARGVVCGLVCEAVRGVCQ